MQTARGHALLVITVAVVWGLAAPLGYASLFDQTWLGGLWDGGDDEVLMLEVQSTIGTVDAFVDTLSDSSLFSTWFTPPPLQTTVVPPTVSPKQTRAPPVQ